MKKIITLTLLLVSITTYTQKVKFKKGNILVDGINWCKYEKVGTNNKEIYTSLKGEEYLSVSFLSCGKGEDYVEYQEIHFFNTEIERFEVRLGYKDLIRNLIKEKVLEDGIFNLENAKKFKNKHQEFASDQCVRRNTIIINN